MASKELHVIYGIGGNTGSSIARILVGKGKKVRGVSRSGKAKVPKEVELVKADTLDLNSTKKAASGATHVYHCIGIPYPEWVEKHPVFMTNLIEAAAAQGPETRVMFVDNLYMYGRANAEKGPLKESMKYLAEGKKGKLRGQIADQLMKAHSEGRIRATIGRASDFYGPYATNSVVHYFAFPKAIEGKPIKVFGNIDKKHSYIYLPDFAKGIVTLAESDKAFGEIWHLPHGETKTIKEFHEMFYAEIDKDPSGKIGKAPDAMLAIGGVFSKLVREVKEVVYQAQIDWVVDDSKFRKAFDMEPTPLRKAVHETVEWYKKSG
jgi:nucleoside-diphosphate-sugar epimerase